MGYPLSLDTAVLENCAGLSGWFQISIAHLPEPTICLNQFCGERRSVVDRDPFFALCLRAGRWKMVITRDKSHA